ncbi:MAG: hypothetical protein RR255_04160 [Bacilli bacterium]
MIYLMNEDDNIRLDEFTTLSLEIEHVYNKLYSLEIDGYKDSMMYITYLLELTSLIMKEHEILDKYIKKETVARAYIKKIDSYLKDDNSSYKQMLYYLNTPNMHLLRLKQILYIKIEIFKEKSLFLGVHDAYDLKQEYEQKNIKNVLVKSGLEEDYINAFLSLIDARILTENNKKTKDLLIYIKYKLFFIRPDIHNNIADFSNEKCPLCFTSQIIGDILYFDDEEYQILKKHFSTKNYQEDIKALLEMKDGDYNEIEAISCFIRSCLVRSSLLLMDNDTRKRTINKYTNILLGSFSKEQLSDNSLGEKVLFDVLENNSKDNEIPWNLSLINHN